jgi:hypothetical protein
LGCFNAPFSILIISKFIKCGSANFWWLFIFVILSSLLPHTRSRQCLRESRVAMSMANQQSFFIYHARDPCEMESTRFNTILTTEFLSLVHWRRSVAQFIKMI